jgi:hypothetical protein
MDLIAVSVAVSGSVIQRRFGLTLQLFDSP